MIVLAGSIDFDPQHAESLMVAVSAVVEATRAEEGCVQYVIAADPVQPGRLCLFERWETEENLRAHQKAPHSHTFQQSLGECGMSGVSIDLYDVASVTKFL